MAVDENRIETLRARVKQDADSEACVELARLLLEQSETRPEAREVLFAGLAKDPHNALARLLLARSFYLDDLLEFSVRELVELKKHSKVPSLDKLLDAFGAFAMPYLPSTAVAKESEVPKGDASGSEEAIASDDEDDGEILAEIDIDDEFLDALDELEEE